SRLLCLASSRIWEPEALQVAPSNTLLNCAGVNSRCSGVNPRFTCKSGLRLTACDGPWRDEEPELHDRSWSPSEHGNRGCAYASKRWVGKLFSSSDTCVIYRIVEM